MSMETNLDLSTYTNVKAALSRPDFFKLPKWTQQQGRANRKGAHPDLLEFEKALINRLRKMNIPMFSFYVIRDGETQDRLYKEGFTKARSGRSPHQYGLAFDLIHSVYGWELPKEKGEKQAIKAWSMIHEIGLDVAKNIGVKVVHGHDWDNDGDIHDQSLWDPAHWELQGWRDIAHQYPFSEFWKGQGNGMRNGSRK